MSMVMLFKWMMSGLSSVPITWQYVYGKKVYLDLMLMCGRSVYVDDNAE